MATHVIEVQPRTAGGKGEARKLRERGQVPGVLYGHKQEPVPFQFDPVALRKNIRDSGMGRNTVFDVRGLGRTVTALLKDAQFDPVRRDILHVDLIEVKDSDVVTVDVPVDFQGRPIGLQDGGILQLVRRVVAVRCSPLSIPKDVKVDVSELKIGDALHVSDIKFPEGAKNAYPEGTNFAICTVRAPKEEVVATPAAGAEGVAAEGAAPAAGAEGAPAAGAPAAAAPAAGEDKKKK